MKCRLVQDCKGPNPAFRIDEHDAAKRSGGTYSVPRDRTLPAGTEIEDRHCWRLCVPQAMNSPAMAEPADDECRAMVARWMAQRSDRLAMVAQAVRSGQRGTTTDRRGRAHAKALGEAYGNELEASDGVAGEEG